MIRIRGPDQARRIVHSDIRRLVERRLADICKDERYDPEIHGEMIVVVPGDTVEHLEEVSGCCILHSFFDDARFGDPEFSPSFEALEEHPTCYEMVFILSDDGFGVEFFIPKQRGIEPELLALCAAYAVPAEHPDRLI